MRKLILVVLLTLAAMLPAKADGIGQGPEMHHAPVISEWLLPLGPSNIAELLAYDSDCQPLPTDLRQVLQQRAQILNQEQRERFPRGRAG